MRYLPDIIKLAGVSPGLVRILAGQSLHAGFAAVIYGLMATISVFMEIAYQYDHLGAMAWNAAPVVFIWTAISVFGAMEIDRRGTSRGRRFGLAASSLFLGLTGSLLYLGMRPLLPSVSVTQATFQTWTAQAAFLKGIIYCYGFTTVFLLVPFHLILAMYRELRNGRHRMIFESLTGGKFAVAPREVPYVPVWTLGLLLIFGAGYSLLSTAHLLEALRPTEYTNLFIHTILVRWVLFLALGLECIAWYFLSLNAIKAESAFGCRIVSHGGDRNG